MTEKKIEKTLPKSNCLKFWENMLFYNKAFLPVSTIVIIEATIKHLKGKNVDSIEPEPPPSGPEEYYYKGFGSPYDPADTWSKRLWNWLFSEKEGK